MAAQSFSLAFDAATKDVKHPRLPAQPGRTGLKCLPQMAAAVVVPGPEGPAEKEIRAKGPGPKYPGPKDGVKCLPVDREFASGGREKYRR